MVALVVRTLEAKQLGQTCAVRVVFNHAKFDAKIKEENSVIRRYGLVDIAEKVREARLRWCGHVIRRDEGKLVRDIME